MKIYHHKDDWKPGDPVYGVYNTEERIWYGDSEGPLLYDSGEIAEVVARVLDVRIGNPAGRTRAAIFNGADLTKKDDIPTKISTERAIEMLENGEVL